MGSVHHCLSFLPRPSKPYHSCLLVVATGATPPAYTVSQNLQLDGGYLAIKSSASTPSSPPSGYQSIYFKSDGTLAYQTSGGSGSLLLPNALPNLSDEKAASTLLPNALPNLSDEKAASTLRAVVEGARVGPLAYV